MRPSNPARRSCSKITVAATDGSWRSIATISSLNGSSFDPTDLRTYRGGLANANNRVTVLRLIPNRRAIAACDRPSR